MRTSIKKYIGAIGAAIAIGGASQSQAQIPVTDIAGLVQAIQQVMTAYDQLTELQHQLKQAEKQYDAITGARGMTELLNNPAARQFLPSDMQDVLEATSALTNKYKAGGRLLKNNAWQDAAMQAAKHLDGQETSAATDLANSEVTYKRAGDRIDEYQDFVDKIDDSTDPKAIQDLQARVQAEQVFLQNETVRLQSMQIAQQAKNDMAAVREKEMLVNMGMPSGIDHSTAFE